MDCYEGLFGLGSVTYPVEEGIPCDMIATLAQNAVNTGAAILVGTDGDRFVNESETVRHGHLYENGIWENPTFPKRSGTSLMRPRRARSRLLVQCLKSSWPS